MKELYKGDIVSCPQCKSDLFKLRRNISPGTVLRAIDFAPLPGIPAPEPHIRMNCPECREPYGRYMGWGIEMHMKTMGWY